MKSKTEIAVEFEGQRARRYVNEEPDVIQVNGICNLT
jgi:hypothetical protein